MGQCLWCLCHHDTNNFESSPVHLMNVGQRQVAALTLIQGQPTWALSSPVGCY